MTVGGFGVDAEEECAELSMISGKRVPRSMMFWRAVGKLVGQWGHWIAVRAVDMAVRRGRREMGKTGGGRDWKEVSVE